MFPSLSVRQLRHRLLGLVSRSSGRPRACAARRQVRPCLETLEDRLTPAVGSSVSLTSASIVPNPVNSTAQVTLTAHVSSPTAVVNQGVVTFSLDGIMGQSNVANGSATAQLTVPLLDVLVVANIALSYRDTAVPINFTNGSGSGILGTNFFTTMMPSSITVAADGSEQVNVQVMGQTLISFHYTASGLPTQITVASLAPLPVTYTNVAGSVAADIDGTLWQLTLFNALDQYVGIATLGLLSNGSTEWLLLDVSNQIVGVFP